MRLVDTKNITDIKDINDFLELPSWAFILIHIYHNLMLVLALTGNSVILYGSLLYKAISLDAVSLVFLENLAVLDFLLALMSGIPVLFTLYAKKWILGEAICFIQGMLGYIPVFTETITLAAISVYRLHKLIDPFKMLRVKPSRVRAFLVLLWGLCTVYVMIAVCMGHKAYFDPYILSCMGSGLTDPDIRSIIFCMAAATIFFNIPLLIIVISNIGMLCITSRHRSKRAGQIGPGKNALLTVSCISWVFVISVVPYTIRAVIQVFHIDAPAWFYVMQNEFYYLNVMFNPVIYSITNVTFRNFLQEMWSRVFSKLKRRNTRMLEIVSLRIKQSSDVQQNPTAS